MAQACISSELQHPEFLQGLGKSLKEGGVASGEAAPTTGIGRAIAQ